MKNSIFLTIALFGMVTAASAQNINWQAFQPEQKHLITLTTGWDYGLTLGLGYGHKFNTKLPILTNIEFSLPSGENLVDDFKVRLGGQVQLFNVSGFTLTAKTYCPIRRYENSKASIFSFGSEFSGVVGFYRPKWFVAGEFGIDKAIATHINHLAEARADYPGIQDGWYVPTGGNYAYGLQAGCSIGRNDLSLKFGKLSSQGWKTAPYIPLFAQIGYQRRF